MCDYSLHVAATRPAKVGERLVSTSFRGCATRGFAAPNAPKVAVCIQPGTELVFDRAVEIDYGLGPLLPRLGFGQIGQTTARFRYINQHISEMHHDALEFPNGRLVLVTQLRKGQFVTVLQLPATNPAATTRAAWPAVSRPVAHRCDEVA